AVIVLIGSLVGAVNRAYGTGLGLGQGRHYRAASVQRMARISSIVFASRISISKSCFSTIRFASKRDSPVARSSRMRSILDFIAPSPPDKQHHKPPYPSTSAGTRVPAWLWHRHI